MGIHKLSATQVKNAKPGEHGPSMHGDGGGLWLQCTGSAGGSVGRSWIFRWYSGSGKQKREFKLGLGSARDVSLAEARRQAAALRRLREQGIDPLAHREAERVKAKLEAAKGMTFDAAKDAYIRSHSAGWRNAKHAAQWTATLTTYVTPVFGTLPVAMVDTALVMKAIEPIWTVKSETASRVRGRIEAVLDWAKVSGYRDGENPARWRGHLDHLLPARGKVQKIEHHAALPYAEIGTFMVDLRGLGSVSALATEFTILTAARTSETIGATWPEIDLAQRVWTVPAERMKSEREHRVPLSDAAIGVLERMTEFRQSDDGHVFPGAGFGRELSNMAMLELLRGLRPGLTVHGFRSTFRDWGAEKTNFPSEVIEMALAHVIESKTEAAYRRGDLFDKRRRLMDAWAGYCVKVPSVGGSVASLDERRRQLVS